MFSPSRRQFLGASVAGLASSPLFGDPPRGWPATTPRSSRPPCSSPGTATRRPRWTSSGSASAARRPTRPSTSPGRRQRAGPRRLAGAEATAKPYPLTDFKVFRAELTGLDAGDRLHVQDRQAVAGVPLPHHAGEGDRRHHVRLRRRLRGERGGPGEQRAGRPPGPDVRRRRRRPGVRQRQVGRDEPGVPEELQPDDGRPGRAGSSRWSPASATTRWTAATPSRATRRRSSTPCSTAYTPRRGTRRSTSATT